MNPERFQYYKIKKSNSLVEWRGEKVPSGRLVVYKFPFVDKELFVTKDELEPIDIEAPLP